MLGRTGSAGRIGRDHTARAPGSASPRRTGGAALPGAGGLASALSSASLRLAVVGPLDPGAGPLAAHTVRLAQQLADAGHDVTLVSWSAEPTETFTDSTGPAPFPRTVRSLARNRPDTWVRTGRRLRAYDTVVVVHAGVALLPMCLAVLRAAGVGGPERPGADEPARPRGVLVCDHLGPAREGTVAGSLVAAALRSVDGVLAHRPSEAERAAGLGAARVYLVPEPSAALTSPGAVCDPAEEDEVSDAWAAYLGAVEALAAPLVPATDPDEPAELSDPSRGPGRHPHLDRVEAALPPGPAAALRAATARVRAVDGAARALVAARRRVDLGRDDLPDWVLATDILDDAWRADEARDEARRLGLPRTRDAVGAWAALGALAAVLRVADDGRHAAVVVDESGPGSPLTRWLRACGFAPVDLGLTTEEAGYDVLEVDAASLDVVARVHPGGCDATDVDAAVAQAAWALRPGGLLVLTLPLGRPGAPDALGPADVRAVVARAHDHGFVLVGDLDGDVGRVMRSAARAAEGTPARVAGAAYGLVRLTLRRR